MVKYLTMNIRNAAQVTKSPVSISSRNQADVVTPGSEVKKAPLLGATGNVIATSLIVTGFGVLSMLNPEYGVAIIGYFLTTYGRK